MDIDARLSELGLTLPDAPAPAANYVPFTRVGGQVWISGQVSIAEDGAFITGKVGSDLSVEDGAAAARRCAMGILAQIHAACGGDWTKFDRMVKLVGFVNSTPDFTEQPKVVNGASDLLVEVFGERGRHARSAVSAGALPLGVAVEVEAVIQMK